MKNSEETNIKGTKAVQDSIASEIDRIYSLLTYAIVYKYWNPIDREGRGYNVGCILVDSNHIVLDYGMNHVSQLENATQHGELRMITSYLNKKGIYSLENHTIYSTLEPCAMCGGMMTMVSIKRVVNGQPDYYFSKALERLEIDSRSIGGYPPYPRIVKSEETNTEYGNLLDLAYKNYIRGGNKPIITKFLTTEKAKEIYTAAHTEFIRYKPTNTSNEMIYDNAIIFYQSLTEKPK